MKHTLTCIAAMTLAALLGSCTKESRLEITPAQKYNGEMVELATYGDSTVLLSGHISDGRVAFDYSGIDVKMPLLAQVLINGRTRGLVIIEEGVAMLDSLSSVAAGTPLNDRFHQLMARADSIENLDDQAAYMKYVEKTFNDNKDNPIGEYFATELTRYLEASQIDSLLGAAPAGLARSKRIQRYRNAAALRQRTAPGSRFVDFSAMQPSGSEMSLAQFAGKGKWLVVDFWASWCPYCIKELPQLKEIYANYKDKGLEILGVAVRDKAADTRTAIEKYGITWPVMYNAGRKPYDIYGFTGIPHLMLINPDGIIVSRGITSRQLADTLARTLK